MKILTILFLALVSSLTISAQEIKQIYYQGNINNRSVRLYLKKEPNPCGGDTGFLYHGIYQYGHGKNWIELTITENKKGNFCMAEYNFTGVLILKQDANSMKGDWISPDGIKHLKVLLIEQNLSPAEKEEMEKDMEKTFYENNDC